MIRKAYKVIKLIHLKWCTFISTVLFKIVLRCNGVALGKNVRAIGIPKVNVSLGGVCLIGDAFYCRTGYFFTEVGSVGSRILVGPKGVLKIGNNVGMSNATIVADEAVTIGDNVLIGGGVQIFDTNFHSTDASIRSSGKESRADVKTKPVVIGNNVFIGTNAIICKGVRISDGAIVPARAVVYKDLPGEK